MSNPKRFLTSLATKHPKQLLAAGAALCCAIGIGIAAAPPAGSVIGNQASATYTDSTNTVRTSSSNLVQTTVAQVNAYTLTAGATKSVAPGGTVYFPHTITNTGNGADTYQLGAADAGAGALTTLLCNAGTVAAPLPSGCNVFLYPDGNNTGVPSGPFLTTASGLTTPSIAAGSPYRFIMGVVWPAAITTGSETVNVSAASLGGANGSAAAPAAPVNADIINVSQAAVIAVTKSFSVTSGARSSPSPACVSPYVSSAACINTTVTLNYTNSGGSAADLTITDTIGSGPTAGLRYVLGSGQWSGCSPTVLTDATGTEAVACGAMTYEAITTAGVTVVKAIIPNVGAGVSGTVSFQVNISDTAAIGTAGTSNTASTSYALGAGPITTGTTNTATYTVAATAGVVANNTVASAANAVADNTVTVASAPQGGTVWFANMIWNTGTVTDTFDVSFQLPGALTAFPAGTNLTFWSDTNASCPATTPASVASLTAPTGVGSALLDSNGNGVADTGQIAPGACKVVWVRVGLLAETAVNTPGFSVNLRATSVNDATKLDEVTNTLTDIVERAVDLTNSTQVGAGTQVGTGATFQGNVASPTVVTTNTGVLPGTTTKFNLVVANTAGAADNYDLSAWNTYSVVGSGGFTSAFGTGVSAGYSAAYYLGTCATAGATPVTNTGNVATGASVNVCAIVTVPANAAAGTKEIYFRVESPSAKSYVTPYAGWDVKHDAFTVAATTNVTITPDRSGSAVPGGNALYAHQVCNTGNSAATVNIASSNSSAGTFNTALWLDVDNSLTVLAPPDVAIPVGGGTILVAAGSCVGILDNSFVGAGASIGSSNTTTITATEGGTVATPPTAGTVGSAMTGGVVKGTVLDTTTVVTGDVGLVKEQREVTCAGGGAGVGVAGAQGTFTQNALPSKVNPGACLQYRITATNTGSLPATALSITDSTPTWTTANSAACSSGVTHSGGTVVLMNAIATGSTGTFTAGPAASLTPGQTLVMVFCVKVDQ